MRVAPPAPAPAAAGEAPLLRVARPARLRAGEPVVGELDQAAGELELGQARPQRAARGSRARRRTAARPSAARRVFPPAGRAAEEHLLVVQEQERLLARGRRERAVAEPRRPTRRYRSSIAARSVVREPAISSSSSSLYVCIVVVAPVVVLVGAARSSVVAVEEPLEDAGLVERAQRPASLCSAGSIGSPVSGSTGSAGRRVSGRRVQSSLAQLVQRGEVGRGRPAPCPARELLRVGDVGGVDQLLDVGELLRSLRRGAARRRLPRPRGRVARARSFQRSLAPVPLDRAHADPELVGDRLVAALLGRQRRRRRGTPAPSRSRAGRGR